MRNGVLIALAAGCITSSASAQWVTFADQTAERLDLITVGLNDSMEKDVLAADFDEDGWIDVVVVRKVPFSNPGKRTDVLLMNEGGTLVDRTNELAPGFMDTPTDARDVAAADIDNDGDLDLIIANTFFQKPSCYINQGWDNDGNWLGFVDESERVDEVGGQVGVIQMCSVAIGDLDADNDLDIYYTNYESGTDLLHINDGTGHFTDETQARMGNLANVAFGTKTQMRDLDKDGDLDIIKTSTLYSQPPFSLGLFVLWNNGDGTFSEFDEVPNNAPYMFEITDLDNDDDYDMWIVQDPQDRYLHATVNGQNNVSWQSFTPNPSPRTGGFGGNADSVDIDNDGDRDIMVTPVDVDIANCNSGVYALLQNDGNGHLTDPWPGNQNQPWHTFAHDAVQFDIDGDGCQDIFQGLCTGWRIFIQTDGNCDPGCYADFDGDGSLTILDFVAYQNAFTSGDEAADCDGSGSLDILDFVCFQNAFTDGC